MDRGSALFYTRKVTKYEDGVPSFYPCMMQKEDVRRIHHPHAETVVVRKRRLRNAVARLLALRVLRGDAHA